MQSLKRLYLGIILSLSLHCSLNAQIPDHLKTPYWDLVKLNNTRQYQAAILQGRILVALAPKFPYAYGQLALAFEKAEQVTPGLAYFDSLRQQGPDNPYVYYAIAMLEKSRKNFEPAMGNMKVCIKLDPKFAPAYLQFATFCNEQKDLETATKYFQDLLQQDSLNAAAYYGLGCLYRFRKEWAKAAEVLDKSLKLDPDIIHAYYVKGLMHVMQRDFQKALEVWDKGKEVAARLNDLQWQGIMTMNVGNAYYDLGQPKKSVAYREAALELARQIGDRRQVMQHLSNLSTSDVALGLYDKAIMRLLEALKIAEAIEPPFQENIFINLSTAYNHKSDYASALFNARKALHMAEARGDSAAVADHCNNIGVALYERGEAPAALRYLERALNIIRISDDKRELASLLGNIGNAYKAEGEIDTALVFYNEALKIAGTLSHKPTLMEALGWVGYAHNAVSEYAKGLDYINQALALARELGDKEAEGIYLGNLGSVYMRLGNFNLAEEKLQQAKNILTTIGNQRGAIRQTVNLGEIHELRGDYLGSLEAHKQALALAQKYEVKDHAAMALQGLGGVYRKIGDPEEALKYLEQALKIHRELRFKEGELEALYAIGLALKSLGKNRRAEDSLKKALPLARAINKQQSEVNCLTALGNLQQQSKQYAAALNYYQQALALATKTGHKEQEGWLYFNLGNLHLAQAEPASARVFFEKARASGERMQAFDLMHESLGGLAKVAEKQKRYADALKYYSEAIDKIESVRERLKIESYKTSFIESKLEVYEAVITLLIRLGRFEEAYEYLQRFRSRSFLEMLGPQRSDFAKGISSELWVRYRFWESKLREIYDRLGNEYGKDKRSEKKIAALNDSLQRLQQEHEKVCEEIRLRHPRAADEQGLTHPLDLKGIQQKVLQPSQSLVEYFSGPEITAAFVIQANSFHCEVLKLKREELENGVGKIRAPFQQVKEGLIRNLADVGFDLKLAQQLYERLFQPLEKYLAANTQLLIVPDGVLHYLPFEALVTSVENKKPAPQALFARYENARFLMEKYVITYAPAASILALERDTNADDGKPAGRLLGFGNPDFGRFKDSSRVDLVLKASKGLLFAPLSDRDVREVAQIMQPASVFTGKDATEERFKQEANRFAGIYLSTHAIVNENQPMYSLIAFAQDDDDEEDGFLHTYEVFNLKLNADLVTLSACETGLGKLSRGEGLIGLTRGFIYAGAPAVLVSLWSVDESTAALMKIFYQNLKAGMGKAEALRQAKLKLIRTRENGVSFAHPFLWAPFVLVGEM